MKNIKRTFCNVIEKTLQKKFTEILEKCNEITKQFLRIFEGITENF